MKKIIQFSYKNIPYYHSLLNKLNLTPEDFHSIGDLHKLPILTKEIIRNNPKDFFYASKNKNDYLHSSTGGSTGVPLHYRLSKNDEVLGVATLYANWGYAGYKLGNRTAVIAGSSLIPSIRSNYREKIRAIMMNNKNFSSFDLNEKFIDEIITKLNRFKPKYVRGYASSIYLLAKYVKENNIRITFRPKGVFTTAEVLHDFQREIIENIFNCNVFDQYGLNDGGLSAYECEAHNGLHIDMLRSIMEVVDDDCNQCNYGEKGKILATTLHNYAMPLIRYDTGDLGILSDKKCTCGRNLPLLKKIIGRTTDYLKFSNGAIIGAPILTVLFGKFDIIQYQIIQENANTIIINIIKGNKFSADDEKEIKNIFYKHVGKININFKYVDKIVTTKAGKWKFIVNELNNDIIEN